MATTVLLVDGVGNGVLCPGEYVQSGWIILRWPTAVFVQTDERWATETETLDVYRLRDGGTPTIRNIHTYFLPCSTA